jgi:hypothetical protein
MESLGENVMLSKFSKRKINYFLNNYHLLKRKTPLNIENKPSEEILDYLLRKNHNKK